MMNSRDREAINGLFDRIEDVARNSEPRDQDAEQLIQQRLGTYPTAPYYMAQTILIQEEALRQANQRIEELERQANRGGGFLGGLFGDNHQDRQAPPRRGPWGPSAEADRGPERGGGFLAGAAQTALGVTGGVLLGSAIAGMLSGSAEADEFNADPQGDAGQDDFGGVDFGDDEFDTGGDF